MERDRRPLFLWLLFTAADALVSAYYWPRLPHLMAQHFDAAGRPNGFASKESFFALMAGLIVGLGVLLFGLPKVLRRLPFALVNIPHKDYWEATPERQKLAWDMVEQQMDWLAVAVNALLSFTLYVTLAANLAPGSGLDDRGFLAGLLAFFAFMAGWMVVFVRRFRPPDVP